MPPAEALIWGFWFLSLLRPLWRGSHPPLQGFPDPCMDPEPTPGRSHGQVDRAGHEDFLVCSLTVIYAFGGQAGAALWVLWETRLTAALSSLGHHVLARTCSGRLSWGLFSLSTPLLAIARVAGFSRWMKDPGGQRLPCVQTGTCLHGGWGEAGPSQAWKRRKEIIKTSTEIGKHTRWH